eukprot:PhM_4_TR18005/c3_g1_i1/m.89045
MQELSKSSAIRISQLGSLASVQHGALPQTLLALHRGYVESKLLQGAALYALPQKSRDEDTNRVALDTLASAQRRSLKAAAGLLPSTDDESTYLETRSLPLQELARLRAAYLAEKYQRTRPWWYVRPPPQTPNARSHSLVPQPRSMLERIHIVSWSARMPPDLLRCPRLIRLPFAPWSTSRSHAISFGCTLPPADSPAHKLALSLAALEKFVPLATLATDGSVIPADERSPSRSMAAAVLRYGNSVARITQSCGPVADSYRTETVALQIGLDMTCKAVSELPPSSNPLLLIVSDSQSALKRLARGPLAQTTDTESDIWHMLLDLAEHTAVHLQFVYGHCGVVPNEEADELAASRIAMIPTTAPLSEANARAHIKHNVIAAWKERLGVSHRSSLVGHCPTPRDGSCAISGNPLSREEQVHLARLRVGQCDLFGTFRRRIHTNPLATSAPCRWCAPDAPCTPDLVPAPDAPPPATVACPGADCDFTASRIENLDLHIRKAHKEGGMAKCLWCGMTFVSPRSRGMHYKACTPRRTAADALKPAEPPPHIVDPEPPPPETISHFFECPHAAPSRERHHVHAF